METITNNFKMDKIDDVQKCHTNHIFITNFCKEEESLYREAIKRFSQKCLYIEHIAYRKNGTKDDNLMALYCTHKISLTQFWDIYESLKKEM